MISLTNEKSQIGHNSATSELKRTSTEKQTMKKFDDITALERLLHGP